MASRAGRQTCRSISTSVYPILLCYYVLCHKIKDYSPFNSTPHSEVFRVDKNHAMERVEVRLHPFLTSAEDTLSVHWERCSWYERSCEENKFLLAPNFHFVSVAWLLTDCRYLLYDRLGWPLCPSCRSEEIFPCSVENRTPVFSPVASFFARWNVSRLTR
jgi:hypothetical protein